MKRRISKFYTRYYCKRIMIIFSVFLIITLLLSMFYNAVTPLILPISIQKLDDMLASAGNRVVNRIEIADIIYKTYDKNGNIASVSCSSFEISKICNNILVEIEKELLDKRLKITVPIGTLTGSNMLSDKGFPITVCLSHTHNISATPISTVEPYAINQSIYKLSIEITYDEVIILPGGKAEERSFTHSVPLYETIIIGEIPNAYINTE